MQARGRRWLPSSRTIMFLIPGTIYAGASQIPPACVVVLENGHLSKPEEYWRLVFAGDTPPSRLRRGPLWDTALARVRVLLREAVERPLVSDVPLGALLSGGPDSSAIVGLLV